MPGGNGHLNLYLTPTTIPPPPLFPNTLCLSLPLFFPLPLYLSPIHGVLHYDTAHTNSAQLAPNNVDY